MRKISHLVLSTVLPCIALAGQDQNNDRFDVASVKAVERPSLGERRGCTGGPGTLSPMNWTCAHVQLTDLIFRAYDLELYQSKRPEWVDEIFLSVAARAPEGTTKEQFRRMQQNLLEERFKLAFHREPREATVYTLFVGRSGLRMHASAEGSPAAETEWSRVPGATIGPDRYPVFPEGKQGLMGVNNHIRWRSSNVTTADIVKVLRRAKKTDVVDGTGLNEKYDVDIFWENESFDIAPHPHPFDGPEIEKALQDRLGLRLESKKGTVSVFVIDHIEKKPVEN